MLARRLLLTSAFSLISILAGTSSAGLLHAAGSKTVLAIVVSKNSSLNSISSRDLKRLYLGENINGPDGDKLLALNQPPSAADRKGFDRVVLGMDPDEVGRYWIDRKIRGQPGPPKTVAPIERLRQAIRHVKGTISYIRTTELERDLKVLPVDGRRPGEQGYAIEY